MIWSETMHDGHTYSNVPRLETCKGIIKELTTLALVLLSCDVIALLDLLGPSAVVTSIALLLHHLLGNVTLLIL